MTRMVLLDANLLIGALDTDSGNALHVAAKNRLEEMLRDGNLKLALTPLIRYEVLRGARVKSIEVLNSILNGFHEFEIRGADALRAAEIYQMAKVNGQNLDKRQFDVFHWVCAESNKLEFLSNDGDIEKIRNLVKVG